MQLLLIFGHLFFFFDFQLFHLFLQPSCLCRITEAVEDIHVHHKADGCIFFFQAVKRVDKISPVISIHAKGGVEAQRGQPMAQGNVNLCLFLFNGHIIGPDLRQR